MLLQGPPTHPPPPLLARATASANAHTAAASRSHTATPARDAVTAASASAGVIPLSSTIQAATTEGAREVADMSWTRTRADGDELSTPLTQATQAARSGGEVGVV